MKEQGNQKDLEPALVAAFAATLISRRDLYPIQLNNGAYVSVHKPLTENIVTAHLKGYITVGAYALDKNGWAKWVCFDADDEKRWNGLLKLSRVFERQAVKPYLEPSRRGGHLWLFTPTIPGFQIRRFAKELLREQKLTKIEIYPKQDRPVTGPGSLVRLPFGIHKLTGRRYHFINPDGTPLAPTIREQIGIFANPERVPQDFIDGVLKNAPEHELLSPTAHFKPQPGNDVSGPPSERIKAAISVFDFVSQYIELDSRGKGICPFHDDQIKSFQVNQEGNYWNCYAGCGGGSIIDFWAKWRKTHNQKSDFKSTVKDLAKMLL